MTDDDQSKKTAENDPVDSSAPITGPTTSSNEENAFSQHAQVPPPLTHRPRPKGVPPRTRRTHRPPKPESPETLIETKSETTATTALTSDSTSEPADSSIYDATIAGQDDAVTSVTGVTLASLEAEPLNESERLLEEIFAEESRAAITSIATESVPSTEVHQTHELTSNEVSFHEAAIADEVQTEEVTPEPVEFSAEAMATTVPNFILVPSPSDSASPINESAPSTSEIESKPDLGTHTELSATANPIEPQQEPDSLQTTDENSHESTAPEILAAPIASPEEPAAQPVADSLIEMSAVESEPAESAPSLESSVQASHIGPETHAVPDSPSENDAVISEPTSVQADEVHADEVHSTEQDAPSEAHVEAESAPVTPLEALPIAPAPLAPQPTREEDEAPLTDSVPKSVRRPLPPPPPPTRRGPPRMPPPARELPMQLESTTPAEGANDSSRAPIHRSRHSRLDVFALIAIAMIMIFQNCSKAKFSANDNPDDDINVAFNPAGVSAFACKAYSAITPDSSGRLEIPARDTVGTCYILKIMNAASFSPSSNNPNQDQEVLSRNHDSDASDPLQTRHPYVLGSAFLTIHMEGARSIQLTGSSASGTPITVDNFLLVGLGPSNLISDPSYYEAYGTSDSTIEYNGKTDSVEFRNQAVPLTPFASSGTSTVTALSLEGEVEIKKDYALDIRALDCGSIGELSDVYLLFQ